MKNKNGTFLKTAVFLFVFISFFGIFYLMNSFAAPEIPSISVNLNTTDSSTDLTDSIELLLFFTLLSILPSILIMMTCFTRIIVILSFLKQAMGAQQTIPSQTLIGLALFLTFFIMAPVGKVAYENGLEPYFQKTITQEEAIENVMKPVRDFMFRQTRESDIKLFLEISKDDSLRNDDVSLDKISNTVLIPAFIISELKTGFQIGFLLFIPFIIIDMIVSSTLMSMGMMMLPPMMISMPFKILLFVLVDGWDLVVRSIVIGFK